MNLNEAFHFASRATEIVRTRKNTLYTFGTTRLPYVCLSTSPRTENEVILRRGEVTAERPAIAVPGKPFRMEGFDFSDEPEENDTIQVLIARRINIPEAKYVNKSEAATTESGSVQEAVERAVNRLDQANDIRTGVLSAPEAVWNLSVLLYVGSQVVRSAPGNIAEHMERLRRQQGK